MSLDDLRRQIDDLDRALVDLLCRRAEVAVQIGEEKRRHHACIQDPARENEVLAHVRQWNRGPTTDADMEALFRDIMTICSRIQRDSEADRG